MAASARDDSPSMSWSSAPASPASTSSTAPARRASPPQLLEAGSGVGGTWFWNRYPGARFDSESYTYGYLFSQELWDEWEWQEHFAEQPEIERYLNHVVDRFDLRRHMRFDARVTSAIYDEASATWTVTTDGRRRECRGALPDQRDGRAVGTALPGRAGARGLPRRAAPHRPVAGDAGRLRRQAGRHHRHRVQRRTDRPGRSPSRRRPSPSTSARPTGARH